MLQAEKVKAERKSQLEQSLRKIAAMERAQEEGRLRRMQSGMTRSLSQAAIRNDSRYLSKLEADKSVYQSLVNDANQRGAFKGSQHAISNLCSLRAEKVRALSKA